MLVLPAERDHHQLQRHEDAPALPVVLRQDRAAQALRRVRLAPAQIGERHQTQPPHGIAAIRGPVAKNGIPRLRSGDLLRGIV